MQAGSTYTGAWKSGKMHGKGKIASNGQEVQGIWEEGVCKQTIDADFDALKGLEMGVSLSERSAVRLSWEIHACPRTSGCCGASLCAGFLTAAHNGRWLNIIFLY
jgi:hypothetical protein